MSNPFQQYRFIMKTRKLEGTVAYEVVEGLFVGTFIVNRALICPFVLYNSVMTDIGLLINLCMSIVYALGLFWIFVILSLVAKKLRSTQQTSMVTAFISCIDWIKKNIYVFWGVITVWTVFLTVGTRMLGWPHYYIEWGGFILA